MKKVLASVAVGMICFAAGRLSRQHPANAKGAGAVAPPPSCQDVNGDGLTNVADPVYLLQWLFVGGPEPLCPDAIADLLPCTVGRGSTVLANGDFNEDGFCDLAMMNPASDSLAYFAGTDSGFAVRREIAIGDGAVGLGSEDYNGDGFLDIGVMNADQCTTVLLGGPDGLVHNGTVCPPATSRLPRTGQTLCYDHDGNVVDCASDSCPGQDGSYQTGCPHDESRFEDNQDGTVTDNCTGLMWQKDTGHDGNRLNWCDALAHCEDLRFAGHENWRLPDVRELQSILQYGRDNPAIAPVFGAEATWYWTSTTLHRSPGWAWNVHFNSGIIDDDSKELSRCVRAVRTIQPGE